MRTYYLLRSFAVGCFLLWGFTSPAVSLAQQEPDKVSVATWNLEWFYDHYQGDNESDLAKEQSAPDRENWEWKKSVVADAIAKFRPTILAVQEIENRKVLMELCDVLQKKHSLNYRVAFIEGFDRATEQDVGILYQHGLVEFSRKEQTKEQFDSKEYYNLSKHLFGRFEWKIGDRKESLLVLTLHLRAKAEEAATRMRQCKLAKLWIDEALRSGQNVIVLGDFNFEEPVGGASAKGDLMTMLGQETPDPADDLVDILERVPQDQRRTHLILEKQFDRLFASSSLLQDDPQTRDFVLEKVEVFPQHNIRGNGPDMDHWDTRNSKAFAERDISDHHPVMATFRVK